MTDENNRVKHEAGFTADAAELWFDFQRDNRQREQTAATILAALIESGAFPRDGLVFEAVRLADSLRDALERKP